LSGDKVLEEISPKFKKRFLLQFTKELIKSSKPKDFFIKFHENESAENSGVESLSQTKDSVVDPVKRGFVKSIMHRPVSKRLKRFNIPEPKLPMRLRNISPRPVNVDIDIGKLNPLVRDPAVKVIECNGPNEGVIVKGDMGVKPTSVSLNQNEIKDVIESFSRQSKIPVTNGIFNVAFGKLILTAIISEVVSPKFVIKKMISPVSRIRGVPGLYAR